MIKVKILIFIFPLIMLSACNDSLTATEMSSKIKECQDNNLSFTTYYNGLTYRIIDIQCKPLDQRQSE